MRRFAPQLFAQVFFICLFLLPAYNSEAQTRPYTSATSSKSTMVSGTPARADPAPSVCSRSKAGGSLRSKRLSPTSNREQQPDGAHV